MRENFTDCPFNRGVETPTVKDPDNLRRKCSSMQYLNAVRLTK